MDTKETKQIDTLIDTLIDTYIDRYIDILIKIGDDLDINICSENPEFVFEESVDEFIEKLENKPLNPRLKKIYDSRPKNINYHF